MQLNMELSYNTNHVWYDQSERKMVFIRCESSYLGYNHNIWAFLSWLVRTFPKSAAFTSLRNLKKKRLKAGTVVLKSGMITKNWQSRKVLLTTWANILHIFSSLFRPFTFCCKEGFPIHIGYLSSLCHYQLITMDDR